MDATESTTNGGLSLAPVSVTRPVPRRRRGVRRTDAVYHAVTLIASLGLVVILAAVVMVLLSTAWPAIGRLGLGVLGGTVWNPSLNLYGALPFIAGTLITTALALLIAVPISLAIAILLQEYSPRPLATTLGIVIEVAAGVPTIVFGAWALLSLVPWLRDTGEPAIAAALGWLPLFNPRDIRTGSGVFPAGLVLAAMVFPTIVAVTRNSFLSTPLDIREASLGLGATRWETATRVVLRQARPGVLGAIVLACGRALGETIAVAYIIGNALQFPRSLFDQGSTLSTELLNQVYGGGAIPGSLTTAALYELGIILLVLALGTSLAGRLLTRRLAGATVVGGGR